jgi:hypothetical protein
MPIRNQFNSEELFLEALRDWFAGQALSSCLKFMSGNTPEDYYERASAEAYSIADAMLSARKQGGE